MCVCVFVVMASIYHGFSRVGILFCDKIMTSKRKKKKKPTTRWVEQVKSQYS